MKNYLLSVCPQLFEKTEWIPEMLQDVQYKKEVERLLIQGKEIAQRKSYAGIGMRCPQRGQLRSDIESLNLSIGKARTQSSQNSPGTAADLRNRRRAYSVAG